MKAFFIFFTLFSSISSICSPVENKFHGTFTKTVDIQYLLYLPSDYNNSNEKLYPLMLYLHGSGERGNDINLVKKHGPLKVAEAKNLPFIILAPQCKDDETWNSDNLITLLDDIISKYRVDRKCICVTGMSMGGFGTWDIAISYPEYFSAIAPVCGWGKALMVHKVKNIPIWVFHGAKDNIVPIINSENMVIPIPELKFIIPSLFLWLFSCVRSC